MNRIQNFQNNNNKKNEPQMVNNFLMFIAIATTNQIVLRYHLTLVIIASNTSDRKS